MILETMRGGPHRSLNGFGPHDSPLLIKHGNRIREMKVGRCLSACKRKSGRRCEGAVFNGKGQSCWQIRRLDDRGDDIWVGSKKVTVPKSSLRKRWL